MHIGGMKLSDYLAMAKISDEQFASVLKKDRTLVGRYRRGEVTPPLDVIAQIEAATDSAVSFRDFLQSETAA